MAFTCASMVRKVQAIKNFVATRENTVKQCMRSAPSVVSLKRAIQAQAEVECYLHLLKILGCEGAETGEEFTVECWTDAVSSAMVEMSSLSFNTDFDEVSEFAFRLSAEFQHIYSAKEVL